MFPKFTIPKCFPLLSERPGDPAAYPDGRHRLRLRALVQHLPRGEALCRQPPRVQTGDLCIYLATLILVPSHAIPFAGGEDEREAGPGPPVAQHPQAAGHRDERAVPDLHGEAQDLLRHIEVSSRILREYLFDYLTRLVVSLSYLLPGN